MKLFYIHGANATPGSFNYLHKQIAQPACFADYNSSNGFYNNLEKMKSQLAQDDWFLVTHSLGGVYAAHLQEFLGSRLKGVVSISAPFGGSELCDLLVMIHPFSRLFRDTGTISRPIIEAQKLMQVSTTSWTAIITNTGPTAYLPTDNDGVISTSSQLKLSDRMETVCIDTNHYEILQDNRVLDIIQHRLLVALSAEKTAAAVA